MLQVEIIYSESENDLVEETNYFLSKIDECLVREIRYSSFFDAKKQCALFSVLIIYLIR